MANNSAPMINSSNIINNILSKTSSTSTAALKKVITSKSNQATNHPHQTNDAQRFAIISELIANEKEYNVDLKEVINVSFAAPTPIRSFSL